MMVLRRLPATIERLPFEQRLAALQGLANTALVAQGEKSNLRSWLPTVAVEYNGEQWQIRGHAGKASDVEAAVVAFIEAQE